MALKKYKTWMIQEGNDEKITIICCGCGKALAEHEAFWADVESNDEIFCSKNCADQPSAELAELQARRFAIEALKSMGMVE